MSGGAADLELDDRALAAAYIAARDEAAFRALYRRHTPALWPMALRMVGGSEESAREVIQETWLRAAGQLPRFRWESALRTWLTGIALNCAREAVRAERRGHPAATFHDVESPAGVGFPTGGGPVAPRAEPMDLARAVDALPEGYRTVLVLHDVEGHTHEEIAAMLGIETVTSRSQLHRARRRLRETLSGGGTAEGGEG